MIIRIIVILLFISVSVFAQSAKIRGIVKGKDKKPINNINVYLSGTALGTTTNNEGEYIISGIPEGVYELVLSSVGYKTQKFDVTVTKNFTVEYDIIFNKEEIELGEVVVVSERPSQWLEYFEVFESQILGDNEYSDQCKIVNKEYLNFDVRNDSLFLNTKIPVEVHNQKLGFKMYIEFKNFLYIFDDEICYFDAFIKFESYLFEGYTETQIKENRRNVYLGSMHHFFKTLTGNTTDEFSYSYSLGDYRDLYTAIEKFSERAIKYDLKDLEINSYNSSYHELNLDKAIKIFAGSRGRGTILIPTNKNIFFDHHGNIINSNEVMIYGYWGNYRFSKRLPLEYTF